jgi:tetratricopeptide (TPR) repeat protein
MGEEIVKYWIELIKSKVGTGDTAKKAVMENFWMAEPLEDDKKIRMILLDSNYESSGYGEVVPLSDLGTRFTPLPADFIPPRIDPKKLKADQITARAERHLAKSEFNSAEFEFTNALKLNEENVRANFGLGKTYLALGETEKAKTMFTKLANIDEMLSAEHKHIFNEFGIELRRIGMYGEAANHYDKALKLSPDDENLWFNKGRCLFEDGKIQDAICALRKSLELNSELADAKQFILYIKQQLEHKPKK